MPWDCYQIIRSAFQRVRGKPPGQCTHLDPSTTSSRRRQATRKCLELGDTWVHLRMCMTDGLVLCTTSSKNKHASRHARARTRASDRSLHEPGEDWLWCYTDETLVQDWARKTLRRGLGRDSRHGPPVLLGVDSDRDILAAIPATSPGGSRPTTTLSPPRPPRARSSSSTLLIKWPDHRRPANWPGPPGRLLLRTSSFIHGP